jgi:hypothetical protein
MKNLATLIGNIKGTKTCFRFVRQTNKSTRQALAVWSSGIVSAWKQMSREIGAG